MSGSHLSPTATSSTTSGIQLHGTEVELFPASESQSQLSEGNPISATENDGLSCSKSIIMRRSADPPETETVSMTNRESITARPTTTTNADQDVLIANVNNNNPPQPVVLNAKIVDIDDEIPDYLDCLKIQKELEKLEDIKVIQCDGSAMVHPSHDVYHMTREMRGICMIFNNMKYENDDKDERHGSEIDANRLKTVFEQLHFKVGLYNDSSLEKYRDTIKEVKESPWIEKGDCDALVIIFLSHGDENSFKMVDGTYLNEKHLVDEFSNESCRGMIGKPKIFFIQACRGKSHNEGVYVDMLKPRGSLVGPMTESGSFVGNNNNGPGGDNSDVHMTPADITASVPTFYHVHTHTDILISYSTIPGYVSYRHTDHGSPYVSGLVYMLSKFAHSHSLNTILNRVGQYVKLYVPSIPDVPGCRYKQVCSYMGMGWTKDVYFNPGLYGTPPQEDIQEDQNVQDPAESSQEAISEEEEEQEPDDFADDEANDQLGLAEEAEANNNNNSTNL